MMWLALAGTALLSPQEPPPPVDVPRRVEHEAPVGERETTLFDGFDALERLHRAWRWRDKSTVDEADARARADAALAHWCRDERRAAVEGWMRLALELEGKDSPGDLLAACLRLELIFGDRPTRNRRGFFSAGMGGHRAPFRVRSLFDLPELAGARIPCTVQIVDLLLGAPKSGDPRRSDFTLRIDEAVAEHTGSIQAGPAGFWDLDVQLWLAHPDRDPLPIDSVVIENDGRTASERRAELLQGTDATDRSAHDHARWRSFAARVELLGEAASLERSREFLVRSTGPASLAPLRLAPVDGVHGSRPLWAESEAFRDSSESPQGVDARNGPVWGTCALDEEREIAAWIRCARGSGPTGSRLVIVLHPESFDEGWAVRLTGGDLFRAARDRDVTLVAPETGPLMADPDALPRLVDAIALEVAVGEVHLVGAGTGADLARRLAERHPKLVTDVLALPRGTNGALYSTLDAFSQILPALH